MIRIDDILGGWFRSKQSPVRTAEPHSDGWTLDRDALHRAFDPSLGVPPLPVRLPRRARWTGLVDMQGRPITGEAQ